MTLTKIIEALELPLEASETQILDRIADFKRTSADAEDATSLIDRVAAGTHEQVGVNDDGSMVVTLLYPIAIGRTGAATITELTLRRPRMKHLRAMDEAKGDMAKAQALLAAVSGRAPRELDDLDTDDLAVCQAVLAFFSRRRPLTGAES